MTTATELTALAVAEPGVARSRRTRDARLWLTGVLVALVVGVAVLGLIVQMLSSTRHLYLHQDLTQTFKPPFTAGHLLGTDNLGRDLAWRIVAGLSVSVVVGVGASLISVILGLVVGILAGFFGQAVDTVANVAIDVTWAFPAILLAIVFAGNIGPGLTAVILALSLTGWASFARIVRGEVLSLRERDYVAAARVLGVSNLRISLRHLLPSLMPLTIVMSVYFVSTSVIAEAGLSFLGLGAQDPTPSLGVILSVGRDYLNISWWPVVLGGATLTIVVLLLNFLGDQLRDRLDPRGRRR